jgi:hypothetical protein
MNNSDDTGLTTYDKLPRGQKQEIDLKRRAAVKTAESTPKRRMGDFVADVAALSPLAPRGSGGAQKFYSEGRQKVIDDTKGRAEYKDLKSGPTKLFKVPEGTPGMSMKDRASLRESQIDRTEDYAKGGKVSGASKRADGIVQRGKTRGKMC